MYPWESLDLPEGEPLLDLTLNLNPLPNTTVYLPVYLYEALRSDKEVEYTLTVADVKETLHTSKKRVELPKYALLGFIRENLDLDLNTLPFNVGVRHQFYTEELHSMLMVNHTLPKPIFQIAESLFEGKPRYAHLHNYAMRSRVYSLKFWERLIVFEEFKYFNAI